MRVLITGCSTGIGRATAARLAQEDHFVVATARRPDTIEDLPVAERLALDVCEDASVEAARDAAGPIDVLINNAGIDASGPLERFPLEQAHAILETNVLGPLRLIRAFLPAMRSRGSGRIVNVSSIAGRVAPPLAGVYAASKHALEALSESLHYEVGHFGVSVVVVQLGSFARETRGERFGEEPPYDALRAVWTGCEARLTGADRPGADEAAAGIAAAAVDPSPPLRRQVGRDAQLVLSARAGLDDTRFEARVRELLGFDW